MFGLSPIPEPPSKFLQLVGGVKSWWCTTEAEPAKSAWDAWTLQGTKGSDLLATQVIYIFLLMAAVLLAKVVYTTEKLISEAQMRQLALLREVTLAEESWKRSIAKMSQRLQTRETAVLHGEQHEAAPTTQIALLTSELQQNPPAIPSATLEEETTN